MDRRMILYIDVETTGLVKYVNGIIALAYIIENNEGVIVEKGKLEMNTFLYKTKVEAKALEVNGYSVEKIKSLPDPKTTILEFNRILNKHFDGDKYKVIAYNSTFDTGFLQEWFNKLLPNTYWKILDYKDIDPFAIIKVYQHLGIINTGKSQSLEAVCNHFGIEHDAHDCESDISATRELWLLLKTSLKEVRCCNDYQAM